MPIISTPTTPYPSNGQGIYRQPPPVNTQANANTQKIGAQNSSVAKSFESFFVFQMLEHMSKGIQAPEIGGGGFAEDTFRSLLNEKIAEEVSKSGRLGIADAIDAQIAYKNAQPTAQPHNPQVEIYK